MLDDARVCAIYFLTYMMIDIYAPKCVALKPGTPQRLFVGLKMLVGITFLLPICIL